MYQAGIQSILGFQKQGSNLVINPCIPKRWQQFSIQYIFEETIYDIQVKNPDAISQGKVKIKINGVLLAGNCIPMIGGQEIQHVEVIMKAQ